MADYAVLRNHISMDTVSAILIFTPLEGMAVHSA
jgi:hypothetical protein